MVHTCNPSYLGGRDQEDPVQRQSRQILHETLSQKKEKKIHQKKGLVECLKM
jgi:hypothetical protein